jgi:nucleoside-diphosphate-sugar epimerase
VLLFQGIIGTQPNTYTYSKALGEMLVWNERSHLPVVIVRPSVITLALKGKKKWGKHN